jgi:DNA-binding response OmpR family regulator
MKDDINLSFFLHTYFKRHDYFIDNTYTAQDGIKKFLSNKFDLALIDIRLSDCNGLDIAQKIRKVSSTFPIIIITDNIDVKDEIKSYDIGVNLFHKKPIVYSLLLSQIKAILKFNNTLNEKTHIKDTVIDHTHRIVNKKGQSVKLTPNEHKLLKLFLNYSYQVFTREDITLKILNNNRDSNLNAVDTLISRLRRKVGKIEDKELIETVYKLGYRVNLNLQDHIKSIIH